MSRFGDELTCRELVEIVTDYLEGAMDPAQSELFEAHLEICGKCQSYMAQIRVTIEQTGALKEENLEGEVGDELLGVFRSWNIARGTAG